MASKLTAIQLLLQQRRAAKRGVASASLLNATIDELSHDLAHLTQQWNTKLVPLLSILPDTSGNDQLSAWNVGLDGQTVFVNSESTALINPLYFNTVENRPRSVAEQFEQLYAEFSELESLVNNTIAGLSFDATQIAIIDTADHFLSMNVEGALAELAVLIDNIVLGTLDLSAVDQDYLPATDNTYDIGSYTMRIAQLFGRELRAISKVGDTVDSVNEHYIIAVDQSANEPGSLLITDSSAAIRLRIGELFVPSNPVKLPSLSQLEINALPVENGVLAYNTDTNKLVGVENGAWENLIQPIVEAGTGWIYVSNVEPQAGGDVEINTYDDIAQTIVEECTSTTFDIRVTLKASYPRFAVNGVEVLTQLGFDPLEGLYTGTYDMTIAGTEDILFTTITPNSLMGAEDTITVNYDAPPELLTLSFTGGYPGSQTELKAGDTFDVTGTTDVSADAIEVANFEASDSVQLLAITPGTSFTVTVVVGNRGVAANQAIRARARKTGTVSGFGGNRTTDELGGTVDGTDVVQLNNTYPSVSVGSVTYPVGQGALKDSENATVANTVSDFDTISYTSPNSDLSISNSTTYEASKTVQRIAGNYNIATTNFRITANRAANDATTVGNGVVYIAHVAATLAVTEPAARLKSGGNDGTSAQDYWITVTASQNLYEAPTLASDPGFGTWQGVGFTQNGPATTWRRQLRVHDDDTKGVATWGAISGKNLAGIITAAITGDGAYTLGGFVARTLTFAAYSDTATMNVMVKDFSKLQAAIFTATNQPAVKFPIGTVTDEENGYTINGIDNATTDVIWLDDGAVSSNSSGTAQITAVEETV